MCYVIKRISDGHYFSDFSSENNEAIWCEKEPWIYPRECDALFVLHHMEWQYFAEAKPYVED